jgi:hypothetical protein
MLKRDRGIRLHWLRLIIKEIFNWQERENISPAFYAEDERQDFLTLLF